jgi:hypothetical protein
MSKTYKLHPLTDTKKPYGVIWFIHEGKEQEFYSVVNEMSGSRLSAFNSDPPSIDDEMAWVKSVFRDIHKKAKVIHTLGKLAAVKKP